LERPVAVEATWEVTPPIEETNWRLEIYPEFPNPFVDERKLEPSVLRTPVIEEMSCRLEMYPAVPHPAKELWRLLPIKLDNPVAVEATCDVTPPIDETS
jgi:hypothetical protein